MPKLSRKMVRQINFTSVFDEILKERFASTLNGYFLDHPPETWSSEQRDAFDMVTRVEDDLKAAILKVLGDTANEQ